MFFFESPSGLCCVGVSDFCMHVAGTEESCYLWHAEQPPRLMSRLCFSEAREISWRGSSPCQTSSRQPVFTAQTHAVAANLLDRTSPWETTVTAGLDKSTGCIPKGLSWRLRQVCGLHRLSTQPALKHSGCSKCMASVQASGASRGQVTESHPTAQMRCALYA